MTNKHGNKINLSLAEWGIIIGILSILITICFFVSSRISNKRSTSNANSAREEIIEYLKNIRTQNKDILYFVIKNSDQNEAILYSITENNINNELQ